MKAGNNFNSEYATVRWNNQDALRSPRSMGASGTNKEAINHDEVVIRTEIDVVENRNKVA